MAEIIAVPDIVLTPAAEPAAKIDVVKLIAPHGESDSLPLPVELNTTSTGLQAFLNEKHIAMVEQLLYKSGDARMAALHAVDSAAALVDFLAFSDMATLKHFLSLDDPVMRDAFVQGLHHPSPVIDAFAQPSPVAIDPVPVRQASPVVNTMLPTMPVASEGSVINVVHEDQRVDDHVQVPAIGAMMMDPGDGEDAGDGAGEADADGGYGGDGIGPDPDVGDGDFGGETGSGDAAPAASEPEATTPSSQESPATETPAGQSTGDATPTDAGSGAEHQFDSSSPQTNTPSDTPGQSNSIRWEEDDPALSPPTQTVQTTTVSPTTEAGRNLTDMVLDFFDPPAVNLTGVGSDAAMPTVGSFLRTMANGAAAVIVAGGIVAAAFFASSSSGHTRSSRDGSHGGHDGDPSHALFDDSEAVTDNSAGSAVGDAAPGNPVAVIEPTPPAATLYVEFALAGANSGNVRGMLDAAENWVEQNAPGLSLHVAGFELRPELRLAANAVMHIMVNMEVRTGESHASGCGGQLISDTAIGLFSAMFRSKTAGGRLPNTELSRSLL